MSATEYVVLVDTNNQQIGVAEKLAAHQKNLLHRAFSVFIFRKGIGTIELLLQQRALHKYHSPGLWTNTCCSHPRVDENIVKAGERRLKEELGIEASLKDLGWFHYNTHFENGLSENEVDHVLVGIVADDLPLKMNPAEVVAYRWAELTAIKQELQHSPHHFTVWFKEAFYKAIISLET